MPSNTAAKSTDTLLISNISRSSSTLNPQQQQALQQQAKQTPRKQQLKQNSTSQPKQQQDPSTDTERGSQVNDETGKFYIGKDFSVFGAVAYSFMHDF